MRVFVTGANGWVGSAVVPELIAAGHQVVGLVRSEQKAEALRAAGGEPLLGSLGDLETLKRAASQADGVIHLAFGLDFTKIAEMAREEQQAIEAFGEVYAGSERPVIITSGFGLLPAGETFTEDLLLAPTIPNFPRAQEQAGFAIAEKGVRAAWVRLPRSVHGVGERHGFVPMVASLAREKGVSAYVGDGQILAVWEPVPEGLDLEAAAALPMVVETAVRSLDLLGVSANQTILVNGGGTMTGFAAVQMALMRGAQVIATAGETFAGRLHDLGAKVTPYGEGMVERVRDIAGGAPDLVLHTALAPRVLPDLIEIVDGDPARVMSISDFDEAGLGVRTTGREPDQVPRYDALAPFAQLAAEGRFTVPVARVFGLEDWRTALELSLNGRAHGKLLILPGRSAAAS